jgi:hypothetical protein
MIYGMTSSSVAVTSPRARTSFGTRLAPRQWVSGFSGALTRRWGHSFGLHERETDLGRICTYPARRA